MGSVKIWLAAGLVGLVVTLWGGSTLQAYTAEECLACHNLKSTQSQRRIDTELLSRSIHADNADCIECHSQVQDESHMQTPGAGAVDCSQCHDQTNRHGTSNADGNRPQCYTCHTRHAIMAKDDPRSTVHAAKLTQTCSQCHAAQCGESDYFSWLPSAKIETHPKADLSGDFSVANCIGCHQGSAVHGETDPINTAECRRCHMTAEGKGALLGFIHPQADPARQPGVFAVAVIYQVVLLLLLAGGIFFFVRKFSGTQRC
jgi:hypothetical protein